MESFKFVVTLENGIHARPAGLLVKEASKYNSEIRVLKGDKVADAKGLFSLMGLAVKNGDEITVEAYGEDEEEVIRELKKFLHDKFCDGGGVGNDGVKG